MSSKECFGKWSFEDMTCMLCEKETLCHVNKEDKEREYKRKIKDKRCHDCMEIIRCNRQIMNCFTNFNRDCNYYKCKCGFECKMQSLIKIQVKCKKTISMETDYYENALFEKDKEYNLYCSKDGMLFYNNGIILGRKEYYRLSTIFDRYFYILQ